MTAKSRTSGAVSIADIMEELGCKIDRAREIMLYELPHYDISATGSKRPTWRAKRKDFDRYLNAREHRPEREAQEAFNNQYLRGVKECKQ